MTENAPQGNNEGGRIILPPEERPSREARAEKAAELAAKETKEKKEKLNLKEKLREALRKLPEIIQAFPDGSRERARAEHTLASVKGALENLGKEGAPDDKYAVAVEGYEGNPQEPYVQYEGVPVDELIHVLRDSVKELNKDFPTKEMLADLKKKTGLLGEAYMTEIEVTEKALIYSKWREAEKEYREMEEKLDLGPSGKSKEFAELADELYKNSQSYFEAHYTKAHGEGGPWTKEEQQKQDLRTRHEAKLMSLDYRNAGSEEANYAGAENVMKYRRELLLQEEVKKEEEKPTVTPAPEPVPVPPVPEPVPVPPEQPPKAPTSEEMKRVAIVDAKAQVELLARKRGTELLNQKLNQDSWLKRKWTQMWEEGYRQQFINEERKKILGQENRPGFIRRALFGAQAFDATGKKNLFAGTGAENQNRDELGSLATRFAEDLHQQSEGEVKKPLEDPEFNTKINDLIHEFASGNMPEAEFDVKKDVLVGEISKKYPDMFAEGGLTADNLLEAARNFRKIREHSGALARVDVNLSVDLGLAKQAIKTEANLNWLDKVVSTTQKYLGPGISAEAVGFGVSIASYFARKPLYWLGGAAGLGGLLGAMRRNVEQKKDLEMHRAERAMGAPEPDPDSPRRETVEKFVYNMRTSAEIIAEVGQLSANFNANPTDAAAADALTKALADAEARHSLSESRRGDLISFSGETALERGRLDFMRTLAEAKVSLKKNGFESDIEKTKAYTDALAAHGKEMDKIDKSEKHHRWSENAKAGVKGAIGGLIVGGLTQEALAFVGDHVKPLHWLRPDGRATALENLYHFFKGDMPTAPTGAGMQEILGLTSSSGVIKIDGTTELIEDSTTGLMALVDKTDHSNILAKVSIDPAGRVIPVPGSYDPNLINFSESKTGGGTRTLEEWITSMKGKFGTNVAEDVWHTKGYLDNDTSLPKVEFNELRLYMGYDAKGNLTIDASKLQQYLQNSAGEQIQGSKHGGKILDVVGEFSKGTIKIGLAPDAAHPTSVLELKYDSAAHKFIAPSGSRIMDFFETDAKGRPVLKGDGVLGIVHQIGVQPDGSKNVEWVNAIRGNGHSIETGENSRIVTEVGRKTPVEWWGPWIWTFGRKPLEEKKEGLINPEGKYAKFDPEHFEGRDIEDEEKKIENIKVKKATVDTRGQKIQEDKKDWEGEYPEKFPLKNEKEIAEFLVSQGSFFMSLEDREKYISLRGADRVSFLMECIKRDREFLEIEDGKGLTKENVQAIVDIVLKQTDKVFSTYGEKSRSLLPAKERIHVVGAMEYQAQMKSAYDSSFGVCFIHSGEIFVNFDALKYQFFNGPRDADSLIVQLKKTIAHEVTHATMASNYWMLETDSGDTVPIQRRSGLLLRRRQAKSKSDFVNNPAQLVIERGRALNEAITEVLAKEVTDEIYKGEKGEGQKSSNLEQSYPAERNILAMLQKKLDIPFDVFAKAVVDRKAFRQLVEKVDGKYKSEKIIRPQFMSLLLSIMDAEFMSHAYEYSVTRKFIQGKKGILITKEMKKKFAANLLDRTGAIKESLVKTYGLIDEEEARKIPIAA